MSTEFDRHPCEACSEHAEAAASRKVWKTPVVITASSMEDAESGGGVNHDNSDAS